MGILKSKLDEELEDVGQVFDDDRGINDRGYYPGEEAAKEEQERRMWELSKYRDDELSDELARRIVEPLNKALTELQNTLKKLNGEDRKPF